MALTKIGSIGINTGIKFAGVTTITTLNSATDTLTIGGPVSIAGTLTYEDVTNVDSVGLITARDGIVVGSGITLSKDGDIFFTGIMTGNGSGLTGVANTDVIFTDKLSLPDNGRIALGIGSDLSIFHNGTNSVINNANGQLLIQTDSDFKIEAADGGNDMIHASATGSVELHHNGTKKIETAATGINPSADSTDDIGTNTIRWRNVYADTLYGDGSNLTGISVGVTTASAQVSGITTVVDISKDDIRLDVTGNVTIDTVGGEEGQSKTLRIVNSGISTVSFNSYFKFPSGGTPNLPTASGAISLISFTVHTQGRVGVASVFLAGASVNFS